MAKKAVVHSSTQRKRAPQLQSETKTEKRAQNLLPNGQTKGRKSKVGHISVLAQSDPREFAAATRHLWIIDTISECPDFETFAEAHTLWDRLMKERTYRISLLPENEDIPDALMDQYKVIDEIADAMADFDADDPSDIAAKINIALSSLNDGGSCQGWEQPLLESASHDIYELSLVTTFEMLQPKPRRDDALVGLTAELRTAWQEIEANEGLTDEQLASLLDARFNDRLGELRNTQPRSIAGIIAKLDFEKWYAKEAGLDKDLLDGVNDAIRNLKKIVKAAER